MIELCDSCDELGSGEITRFSLARIESVVAQPDLGICDKRRRISAKSQRLEASAGQFQEKS